MRFFLLIAVLFASPASAANGQFADLGWETYMQKNVYTQRAKPLDFLELGKPLDPQPGDGVQLRFGVSAVKREGPHYKQEDAPITDAIEAAAPVINTSFFLVALILHILR